MQKTIKDIRKKLLANFYLNEEHVKVSIVSRLLTYLGWNIWNPTEVFYDYPIQRLPLNLNDSPSYGKVSLALFVSQDINRSPEVYIQTTSKGKLLTNITTYEDQLNLYSSYDMAVISILTDGNIWRFYLSSAEGISTQRLFNEFNIIEDSDDFIINILNSILAKTNIDKMRLLQDKVCL